MSSDPEVQESLRHIRAVTARLREVLVGLPPKGWDVQTNCPPWPVQGVVAHVVSSGERFRASVERGVAGLTEPPWPEAQQERRMDELADASPDERIAALDQVTAAIEELYNGLDDEQLEAICFHRRGSRSARWYAKHRLAEVAFHLWDLQHSLGRHAALDDEVAEFLLPMLLESNLPRIYAGGPGGEGRFRLTLAGLPASSWLLTARPDRLDVTRADDEADVTISGSAAPLALLVYGRAELPELERRGLVRVEGDRAVANRFHQIFPKP